MLNRIVENLIGRVNGPLTFRLILQPIIGIRIIVDSAIKALSPAINDLTAAVRGIDQIHRLLHVVGLKDLGDGRIRDRTGQLPLIFPKPGWEDFVWLGVNEIRLYGADNVQVMRRLRTMLEGLIEGLPAHRSPLPLSLSQEAKPFTNGREAFSPRGPIREAGSYSLCHQ